MSSRWYNVAVVVLWLGSMGWLVTAKVLPSMLIGQPPNYATVLEAQRQEPQVGWRIFVRDRPLGWAVSTTKTLPDGGMETRSQVHFDEIPLRELTPDWLHPLLKMVHEPLGRLQMEASSRLLVGPDHRLTSIDSSVLVEPAHYEVKLSGMVTGTRLKITVRAGDFVYPTETYLPPDALIGDALAPQTQMPNLRPGQRWTVPSYSSLRPPNNPIEILQASVEGVETLVWDGQKQRTYLVVYRSDTGFGAAEDETPRGKLWVRPDGTVLKQEMWTIRSKMTFVRMTEQEAADQPAPEVKAPRR